MTTRKIYDATAFIWPSYHPDDRAKIFWLMGMGEWETVMKNLQVTLRHSGSMITGSAGEATGCQAETLKMFGFDGLTHDQFCHEKALLMAKEYTDAHPNQALLITINCWNEWTETSCLQPCTLYGYGYPEAVGRVFGEKPDQ
jgi:hypothetical protein